VSRTSSTEVEAPDGAERWAPPRLESEIVSYASETSEEYESSLGQLDLDRIHWDVSRRLFRAGGYCRSRIEEAPTHEIVVSYPAYTYWGWDRVKEIVRHEMVHAVVFEEYGPDAAPHGDEFRALARRVNAPLRGEEALPYRFELSCSVCGRFLDGLYEPSVRTKSPREYRSSCCMAPLEVDEKRSYHELREF